jgi:hypothetical protein
MSSQIMSSPRSLAPLAPLSHRGRHSPLPPPGALAPLAQAVLLTVAYGDLFDYPLTPDELFAWLPVPCRDREQLERTVTALERQADAGRRLARHDGYLCFAGREEIVALRRRRGEMAARRWPAARRFARWLARVPFVRMVAVCGSQAVENGDRNGDVDLFLVTEKDRLWLVHTATMVLRRLTRLSGRRLGVEICPNYFLTTASLAVETRNLYTAREIVQTVPLWGEAVYDRFLEANRWAEDFLPQGSLDDRRRFVDEPRHGRAVRLLERLLGGRLGDFLDRSVHRLLLRYYHWRLRRHGWTRAHLEDAYRRDRQVVIHGGFGAAVVRRFFAAAADLAPRGELERWFFGRGGEAEAEDRPDPLYAGIMDRRYGSRSGEQTAQVET